MNYRRVFIPALVALAMIHAPESARAQQAGNVELGGFFQLDRLDEATRTKSLGEGAGARIGLFVTKHWELEAEGSFTQADPETPRVSKAQVNYYVARLNYNLPFGSTLGDAIILSAGAGGNRLDGKSDFIISPEIGLRKQFGDVFGIRFDVSSMIAPNPQTSTFQFPAGTNNRNDDAAYNSNFQARIGLNFLFGNSSPPPAPVAKAPAPIDSSAIFAARARARQDSIDRANRARQDSIDAANRRAQAERDAAEKALAAARALLQAPIWFDYDKSEIRADAKATARQAKLALFRANPGMKIRIEGNTDSRGSNEYNMALGLCLANAARRYLVSHGIEESRIDVVSYGEERPVDQGTTDDAYAKNRRDDFVITVGGDNLSVPK